MGRILSREAHECGGRVGEQQQQSRDARAMGFTAPGPPMGEGHPTELRLPWVATKE